jgi:tetratricopeptide (TPR) repeat protein
MGRTEAAWRWVQRKPQQAAQLAAIAGLLLCLGIGGGVSALWLNRAYQQAIQDAVRIEDERQAAQRAQREAVEQRTLALDVLSELVSGVQQELAARPATLSLRQSLLNTAFDGLQRVTEEVDGSRLSHITVDALLQMSAIQNALGNRDSALEHVARAVSIAEQLVEREPDDIEYVRDLANALSNEGHLYREVFAYDDAEPRFERVTRLRKQIADACSDDPNSWHAWVASRQSLLDLAIYRSDYPSAEMGFVELLRDLTQLRERFPEADVFLRDAVVANNRLAIVLATSERADAAEACLQAALQGCEQLLERDAESVIYRGDMASVLVRLARSKLLSGEPSDGLPFALRGSDIYATLAAESPDDVQSRSLMGSSQHLLYELYLAAGDLPAALEATCANVQIQRQLAEKDAASSRYGLLAAEASMAAADLHFRQGELVEAAVAADEAIAFLERAQGAADYVESSGVSKLLESYQTLRRAYDWAGEGVDGILTRIEAEPYTGRVALALLLYTEARADRLDGCPQQWLELVGDMASLRPDQQTHLLLALARCHLLAAGDSGVPAEQDAAFAAESTPRAVHLELGVAYSRRALAQMPMLREYFLKEPDFAVLRRVEAWREGWGNKTENRE